jgi:DNA-binding LytR/AlgR family response regulator
VGDALVRLALDEIDAVEACENYVRFHTLAKSYMVKRTLREVEASLPADRFARVHRSFLVNLSRVDRVEGNVLWMGSRQVPISRGLRGAVLALLPVA